MKPLGFLGTSSSASVSSDQLRTSAKRELGDGRLPAKPRSGGTHAEHASWMIRAAAAAAAAAGATAVAR